MSYTAAERLAKCQTAIDAAMDAIAGGPGSPAYIAYMQDPEGGQTSYRDPNKVLADLLAQEKVLLAAVEDEADDGISRTPIVLVRRRS